MADAARRPMPDHGHQTRAEQAGTCPGSSDGQHNWIEVTTLGDAEFDRFVCGLCPTTAVERRRRSLLGHSISTGTKAAR